MPKQEKTLSVKNSHSQRHYIERQQLPSNGKSNLLKYINLPSDPWSLRKPQDGSRATTADSRAGLQLHPREIPDGEEEQDSKAKFPTSFCKLGALGTKPGSSARL